MKIGDVFVQLGVLDGLFNSIKSLGNEGLLIILWIIGFVAVVCALAAIGTAVYKMKTKKVGEGFKDIGIAVLIACVGVLGAGIVFVYANSISSGIGDKSTTNNQVQQILNQ